MIQHCLQPAGHMHAARHLTRTAWRGITGVAPTIFIPKLAPLDFTAHETQIEKNTAVAIELVRCIKGPKPEPYTRKHTATFHELSTEVESLIGSASKLRRDVRDYEPLDKLSAMERSLRHVMWSYIRDEEGNSKNLYEDPSFDADAYFSGLEKWISYTNADQQRIERMKDEFERNKRYFQLKQKRLEALKSDPNAADHVTLPTMDFEAEYKNVADREVVVEKRIRYNTLNIKTTLKDEAAIDAEMAAYLRPIQLKRLDQICDLLEAFKPLLAREAILQRLTIKHLEGQLGIWRYLDWNPEVRDRAELEADNNCQQWWMPNEEKRLQGVRLYTKTELSERAEKRQLAVVKKATTKLSGADDEQSKQREKLLQEIINMQQRIGRKEGDEEEDTKSQVQLDRPAAEEEVLISIDKDVVKEKGLFGLSAE